jgi:cytidylate kinase
MAHGFDALRPRILITGETAGTGASTTSRILADKLQLPIISGGRYFRGLANRFVVFQQERPDWDAEQQYLAFLSLYEKTFAQYGLPGILVLLNEGVQQGAKGDTLATFSAAVETNQKRTGQIDTIWDYVVDHSTLYDAVSQPGFVWEAKLAVLALHLDQLQSVVAGADALSFPYLSVLLTLDLNLAAQRVGERENRDVHPDEITVRKQRDFARYGELYQIRGQQVDHGDLSRFTDLTIDTKDVGPNEVVALILQTYLEKMETMVEDGELLALPIINDLHAALGELV